MSNAECVRVYKMDLRSKRARSLESVQRARAYLERTPKASNPKMFNNYVAVLAHHMAILAKLDARIAKGETHV